MHNFPSLNQTLVDTLRSLPREVAPLLVVNDPDRATPTGHVLDALLALRPELARAHALVACGTHRFSPARRADHEREHRLERLAAVHWHDADHPAATAQLLADPTRPLLAIGSVEPHWFAGWTGAHKTLTVGLWTRDRIEKNHALALSPRAAPCRLDDNPVHLDLVDALRELAASRQAPLVAIDLVVEATAAAGAPRLVAAAAGDPLEALAAVLPEALARFVDTLELPLDRLVARVAAPLDRSLYQALKGVTNHAGALRPGGALVLVAPCDDGVGIDHFMALLRAGARLDEVAAAIAARGYRLGDHKALRQRQLTELHGLHLGLVCGAALGADDAAACGFERVFDALEPALAWARAVAPGEHERVVEDAAQRVTWLALTQQTDPEADAPSVRERTLSLSGARAVTAVPTPADFDHVLLDIEGTTTPIAFVHEVLFPYAADHVEAFLARRWREPDTRDDVAALRALAAADPTLPDIPGAPGDDHDDVVREATLAVVRRLMAEDRKETALKSLQGRIWRDGYARGELRGQMFPDVREAFERWRARGVSMRIYSSGSIEAQRLIFGHSDAGDLTPWLEGYFDTTTGPKKDAESYRAIARAIAAAPARILFLTDNVDEANAAREAGLRTAVLVRPGNPPAPAHDHPVLHDFAAL